MIVEKRLLVSEGVGNGLDKHIRLIVSVWAVKKKLKGCGGGMYFLWRRLLCRGLELLEEELLDRVFSLRWMLGYWHKDSSQQTGMRKKYRSSTIEWRHVARRGGWQYCTLAAIPRDMVAVRTTGARSVANLQEQCHWQKVGVRAICEREEKQYAHRSKR